MFFFQSRPSMKLCMSVADIEVFPTTFGHNWLDFRISMEGHATQLDKH